MKTSLLSDATEYTCQTENDYKINMAFNFIIVPPQSSTVRTICCKNVDDTVKNAPMRSSKLVPLLTLKLTHNSEMCTNHTSGLIGSCDTLNINIHFLQMGFSQIGSYEMLCMNIHLLQIEIVTIKGLFQWTFTWFLHESSFTFLFKAGILKIQPNNIVLITQDIALRKKWALTKERFPVAWRLQVMMPLNYCNRPFNRSLQLEGLFDPEIWHQWKI